MLHSTYTQAVFVLYKEQISGKHLKQALPMGMHNNLDIFEAKFKINESLRFCKSLFNRESTSNYKETLSNQI